MNKQQLELLDEAYKNWFKKGRTEFEEFADPMFMSEDALGEEKFHKISKEYFIEQIKTDTEFSEKWGLKIEERELSLEERLALVINNFMTFEELSKATYAEFFEKNNIPTKLITITYNDKTIESYE
jgi:hypothetical protein